MKIINQLETDLLRAVQKSTAEERMIAVRAILSSVKPSLEQMEQVAKEQAIQLVNSLIIDVVDAPGCDSPFRGFSAQDVLVVLRKRLIAMGGLDEASFDTTELDRRLKARAQHPQKGHHPQQSKP